MDTFSDRYLINTRWLIKLRWVAIFGQLLTIVVTIGLFRIQLPTVWALIAAISVTVASNLILAFWFSKSNQSGQTDTPWYLILGIVLMMDLFSLTTLLFATGGPNNPFALFFFVNVSLSALVLNRSWAWTLNVMSILCFAALPFCCTRTFRSKGWTLGWVRFAAAETSRCNTWVCWSRLPHAPASLSIS